VATTVELVTSPASHAIAYSRSLKPPPLPSRGAVGRDRHAADDREVDRQQVLDVDRRTVLRRAADGRGAPRRDGERRRIEAEEGVGDGEPGRGHEHRLAVLERALPDRQLR